MINMTTTITTAQVTKVYGVYNLTITEEDEKITIIKADVMAQIREKDELGGYSLSATLGMITQDERGITINGTIRADVLPHIISEFNEIVNELKKEN